MHGKDPLEEKCSHGYRKWDCPICKVSERNPSGARWRFKRIVRH